jgi:hypothetical protein
MNVPSKHIPFLKDSLFFSHPNYSFESTSLINLDGYISENNSLFFTVYGYKAPKRHVFDLPVTSSNKIVKDSFEITLVDLVDNAGVTIKYHPKSFNSKKKHSTYGEFTKKVGDLNQYFLKLPLTQILDGFITVHQNGTIDSLVFLRKNITQTIYINKHLINNQASENAKKNMIHFYKTLEIKNKEFDNQRSNYESKIEKLDNDLKKCKGTDRLLQIEEMPYPEEPFLIREYGLMTVEPKGGFSALIKTITGNIQRLGIERQGIIKLSVTVNQNGYIKFSNDFSSELHKDALMEVKRAIHSIEWIINSPAQRNRIEHNLEITFNLVPQ